MLYSLLLKYGSSLADLTIILIGHMGAGGCQSSFALAPMVVWIPKRGARFRSFHFSDLSVGHEYNYK